jgi:alanine racemase
MGRAAIAILSTQNLLHNVEVIRQKAPNKKVIAMIKANAYGHGLRSVAKRLEEFVDLLGVASIDEALALRRAGVKNSIILMEGVFEASEFEIAAHEGFHVVIHQEDQLNWLEELQLSTALILWIKFDTGMGRLGFFIHQAKAVYSRISKLTCVKSPIGIMSHLACADEKDHVSNYKQINDFETLQSLKGPKSLANSAAIFNFPAYHYDFVRPGIALYGVSPLLNVEASSLELKPVMTLQTQIIAIKKFFKGSTIGYGSRFICCEDMLVGVMAIGYGDGYPRTTREGAPVLIRGRRCKVIGRISMDMTMIDLTLYPEAVIGDRVTLWGEGLPIEEVATYTEHLAYDILCGVQARVKFKWM